MQFYSIKEASRIINLPPTTLRYYDKEGLLPFMGRRESGYRVFSDDDITLLRIIECLKKTGMTIKDIRRFTDWYLEGDASLGKRYQFFLDQKRIVEQQIAEMQESLKLIEYKCWYYEVAIAAGTEAVHDQLPNGGLPQ